MPIRILTVVTEMEEWLELKTKLSDGLPAKSAKDLGGLRPRISKRAPAPTQGASSLRATGMAFGTQKP